MKILGTGSALPGQVVTNDMLAGFLDTSDEWISTRTGIRSRRVLSDETLKDLARDAGLRALADAGVQAEELDFILCSTVQGEEVTPALSCILQGMLGAACPCLDINGACAGFIYALDLADALIASGKGKKILIVCAEAMSRLCDWGDRASCVLFGDGAGAAVVGEGEGLMSIRLTTESNKDVLYAPSYGGNSPYDKSRHALPCLSMAGQEVYKFAVSHSTADLKTVVERAGLALDDVKFFLLHQANSRIIQAVRTRLKLDEARFPTNIAVTGNTSSASVPVLLDEVSRSGALKRGDFIALSAFGAGLTTGACVLRWQK